MGLNSDKTFKVFCINGVYRLPIGRRICFSENPLWDPKIQDGGDPPSSTLMKKYKMQMHITWLLVPR